MILKFVIPALFIMIVSCDKKEVQSKPAVLLLTQRPWILTSAGSDENQNDRVDPSEETIQDCEKDNRYNFFLDGNGNWEENMMQCGTGIAEMPFSWKLINGDTEIDFILSVARILRLNEKEFAIYNETGQVNGRPLKYITIFRH